MVKAPLLKREIESKPESEAKAKPESTEENIEKSKTPQRDPFYSNSGVLLYLHFLRNFPLKSKGNLHVRSSLFYKNSVVKDSEDNQCYWMSEKVLMSDNLEQIPANISKIKEFVKKDDLFQDDKVMPLIQTNTWHKDFYKMLWNNSLKDDLYLILEVIENDDHHPLGITTLKINKNDGSIKYGKYELPVYNYPLRDITNPKLNEDLKFSFAFILNEPMPLVLSKSKDVQNSTVLIPMIEDEESDNETTLVEPKENKSSEPTNADEPVTNNVVEPKTSKPDEPRNVSRTNTDFNYEHKVLIDKKEKDPYSFEDLEDKDSHQSQDTNQTKKEKSPVIEETKHSDRKIDVEDDQTQGVERQKSLKTDDLQHTQESKAIEAEQEKSPKVDNLLDVKEKKTSEKDESLRADDIVESEDEKFTKPRNTQDLEEEKSFKQIQNFDSDEKKSTKLDNDNSQEPEEEKSIKLDNDNSQEPEEEKSTKLDKDNSQEPAEEEKSTKLDNDNSQESEEEKSSQSVKSHDSSEENSPKSSKIQDAEEKK